MNGDIWGTVVVRPRGGKKTHNMVETCGGGKTSNRLTVSTEPRYGEFPVQG